MEQAGSPADEVDSGGLTLMLGQWSLDPPWFQCDSWPASNMIGLVLQNAHC